MIQKNQDEVSLLGMEFFAYHGVLSEERKIGNRYDVDLHLFLDLQEAGLSDNLAHTIDYGKAYEVVAEQMKKPSQLLEHIALEIIQTLLEKFDVLEGCEVKVSKHNPPIGGLATASSVRLKRMRSSYL